MQALGTPVPGYHAPPEATLLARRIFAPIVDGCTVPRATADQTLRRAVALWTRLHGVMSLEAAGHFTGMDVDPSQLYADEVASVVAGLSAPRSSRPKR